MEKNLTAKRKKALDILTVGQLDAICRIFGIEYIWPGATHMRKAILENWNDQIGQTVLSCIRKNT